jgi:hypothetical protein
MSNVILSETNIDAAREILSDLGVEPETIDAIVEMAVNGCDRDAIEALLVPAINESVEFAAFFAMLSGQDVSDTDITAAETEILTEVEADLGVTGEGEGETKISRDLNLGIYDGDGEGDDEEPMFV